MASVTDLATFRRSAAFVRSRLAGLTGLDVDALARRLDDIRPALAAFAADVSAHAPTDAALLYAATHYLCRLLLAAGAAPDEVDRLLDRRAASAAERALTFPETAIRRDARRRRGQGFEMHGENAIS